MNLTKKNYILTAAVIEEKDKALQKLDLAQNNVKTSDRLRLEIRECDDIIWTAWLELAGPNKSVAKFLKDVTSYAYEKMFRTLELGKNYVVLHSYYFLFELTFLNRF